MTIRDKLSDLAGKINLSSNWYNAYDDYYELCWRHKETDEVIILNNSDSRTIYYTDSYENVLDKSKNDYKVIIDTEQIDDIEARSLAKLFMKKGAEKDVDEIVKKIEKSDKPPYKKLNEILENYNK